MNKHWHVTNTSNGQGLVIDEQTGENIAVTYKAENAPLVAIAPELLQFAKDIVRYLGAGRIKQSLPGGLLLDARKI